jgi:hypothetical protein
MSVGSHIKRMKVHEHNFARYYGLSINHDQKKGSAWDCMIPTTGQKIEMKFDFMAAKTGNHFVEFEYSNNGGEDWDESGISLALYQSDYWAVYFGRHSEDYHWYYPQDVLDLAEKINAPVKGIRRNLYGNSGTIRCNGYVIPLAQMEKIEIEAPVPPVQSDVIELF